MTIANLCLVIGHKIAQASKLTRSHRRCVFDLEGYEAKGSFKRQVYFRPPAGSVVTVLIADPQRAQLAEHLLQHHPCPGRSHLRMTQEGIRFGNAQQRVEQTAVPQVASRMFDYPFQGIPGEGRDHSPDEGAVSDLKVVAGGRLGDPEGPGDFRNIENTAGQSAQHAGSDQANTVSTRGRTKPIL